MHPIERLRYVARANGYPQHVIVSEAAHALASFAGDPQGLVTACRRMVSRQPTSAPLVWLCARVLCSGDPRAEIRAALSDLENDTTNRELSFCLPDDATIVILGWPEFASEALRRRGDLEVLVVDVHNEGGGAVLDLLNADINAHDVPVAGLAAAVKEADLVVLEAEVVSPAEILAVSGSYAAAAVAKTKDIPVWCAAGVGRFLPQRMWEPLQQMIIVDDPWEHDTEVLPLSLVDQVIGPRGAQSVEDAIKRIDCPVAPELFKGNIL